MPREYMPLLGRGLALDMSLLNEEWAQRNHGQSLDRLAERGGLAPSEALAIMKKQRWVLRKDLDALEEILELVKRK